MIEKVKKVYVVTQGSYSDYRICAIFDSYKKAKELYDSLLMDQRYAFEDVNIIEEWVLNSVFETEAYWEILMDYETGEVIRKEEKLTNDKLVDETEGRDTYLFRITDFSGRRAIKIAAERHAQLKAERERK